MTLILHRHLLIEVAVVGLLKVWRRIRQWALLVLTRGRSDRVHVAVDLGFEVLVECRGV